MKKILALLIALMLLPCAALADDLSGEWYADLMGISMALTLNNDTTYTLDILGETASGPWTTQDDQVILDPDTDVPMMLVYDSSVPSLTTEMSGVTLIFTQEKPATYVPAAARTDSTLDEFQGAWFAQWAGMGGMVVSVSGTGLDSYMLIDGTTITSYYVEGTNVYVSAPPEGIFANSILTTIEPATSTSPEGAYVYRLLEDGMLAAEMVSSGMSSTIYYERCDPSLIPDVVPAE